MSGQGYGPPELPPLHLTRLECVWLLRRLRPERDSMQNDLTLIEERIHAGHNGHLVEAHRALEAEFHIANGVIGKLWQSCGSLGVRR